MIIIIRDWRTWKLADGWRPSKRQYYWERPEYWVESWRLEQTCCHSDSSEKPSANADVKNSNEWIIIIIIIIENDTHKLLWDTDIQTDHLISARRPDIILIKKKKK